MDSPPPSPGLGKGKSNKRSRNDHSPEPLRRSARVQAFPPEAQSESRRVRQRSDPLQTQQTSSIQATSTSSNPARRRRGRSTASVLRGRRRTAGNGSRSPLEAARGMSEQNINQDNKVVYSTDQDSGGEIPILLSDRPTYRLGHSKSSRSPNATISVADAGQSADLETDQAAEPHVPQTDVAANTASPNTSTTHLANRQAVDAGVPLPSTTASDSSQIPTSITQPAEQAANSDSGAFHTVERHVAASSTPGVTLPAADVPAFSGDPLPGNSMPPPAPRTQSDNQCTEPAAPRAQLLSTADASTGQPATADRPSVRGGLGNAARLTDSRRSGRNSQTDNAANPSGQSNHETSPLPPVNSPNRSDATRTHHQQQTGQAGTSTHIFTGYSTQPFSSGASQTISGHVFPPEGTHIVRALGNSVQGLNYLWQPYEDASGQAKKTSVYINGCHNFCLRTPEHDNDAQQDPRGNQHGVQSPQSNLLRHNQQFLAGQQQQNNCPHHPRPGQHGAEGCQNNVRVGQHSVQVPNCNVPYPPSQWILPGPAGPARPAGPH